MSDSKHDLNQPVDTNNDVNYIYENKKWIQDESNILFKLVAEERYQTIFKYNVHQCECNCLHSRIKYLPHIYDGQFYNLMLWLRNIVKTKEFNSKKYENIIIAKVKTTIILLAQPTITEDINIHKSIVNFIINKMDKLQEKRMEIGNETETESKQYSKEDHIILNYKRL